MRLTMFPFPAPVVTPHDETLIHQRRKTVSSR